MGARLATRLPYALFFASGALGLVYEVLWARQFTRVFGSTALAGTATLSGLFLGLAAGSAALGERAKRWRRPLLAFGLLEIGVGLGAVLVPVALAACAHVYPTLYAGLSTSPRSFALLKLLFAMLAVGPSAFCMGGTLPALGEWAAPVGSGLGRVAGGLYAVNVFGATLGALAVPFVLLPWLGSDLGYACAVAGSLGIGLMACVRGRTDVLRSPAPLQRTAGLGGPSSQVLWLAALSGAGTLALQVLWTRTFGLVHENSIYSFAVVVAVFIVGLAGGAALARGLLGRRCAPGPTLALAWCVAAILIACSPKAFWHLTGGLGYLSAGDWLAGLLRLCGLGFLLVFPAALALGCGLPLLMEMAGRGSGRSTSGALLGRLLGANTLGAILGPLLATFVVAPRLGLWWSLFALGVLFAAAGLAGLVSRARTFVGLASLAVFVAAAPTGLAPVRVRPGERVVSVREGSHGTTAVLEDEHDRWITVDNTYVLGGSASAAEERFQAHLPLLLHSAPRRVALLGLGTGITAGAALLHPVQSLIALELVPEVAAAARSDFAEANQGVLADARVTLVPDDGRNYLAAARRTFDVVVADLFVPWRPAEAPLYSLEHYQAVRRALAEGGIFCQWLPAYQLSDRQLAIIARTFVEVFPHTTLWRGNFVAQAPTLALVGHLDARPLDVAALDARLRALRLVPQLDSPFLVHPAGFWVFQAGAIDPRAAWLAGVPRNRDARPWIELLSPRILDPRVPSGSREPAYWNAAGTPLASSPLASLDAQHLEWKARGAQLARASRDAGPAEVLAILRTLPPELGHALGVDEP